MEKKQGSSSPSKTKDYISIYWKCCHVFSRVRKNKSKTAYEGFCPKCRSYLTVPIGEKGTNQRTFIAG